MNKLMNKIQKATIVFSICAAASLYAGMSDFADKVRDTFGDIAMVNGTDRGSWTDPSTGKVYHSGGSMSFKFKATKNYDPWLDLKAPSVSVGCGGVTFDFGFAGLIDVNEIGEQLQQAGTSLVGGYLSAMMYSTPILGNVIKTVKEIVGRIQAMMQNACNIGRSLGTAHKLEMDKKIDEVALAIDDTEWLKSKSKNDNKAEEGVFTKWAGEANSWMDCMGTASDTNACNDKNSAASVAPIVAIPSLKDSVADPISRNLVRVANRKATFIDYISMKNLYGNGKSDMSMLSPSGLTQGGNKVASQILFALYPPKVASTALCSELRARAAAFKVPDAAERQKMMKSYYEKQKEADSQQKESELRRPAPVVQPRDLLGFIQNGYIGEDIAARGSYKIPAYDFFVVQRAISSGSMETASADGTPRADRKMVTCIGANAADTTDISWVGLTPVDKVADELRNMATGLEAADSSVLITAEVAQAVSAIQKRDTLEYNHVAMKNTPTLDYDSLAYFNNYFIVHKLNGALADFALQLSDPLIGNDSVSGSAPESSLKDTMEMLAVMEKQLEEGLNSSMSNEASITNFLEQLDSDVTYINETMQIANQKKRIR